MTNKPAIKRARRRTTRWKRLGRSLTLCAGAALSVGVIVATLFVGYCAVIKIAKPYREAEQQRVQLAAMQQQSRLLAMQNTGLERRIAYLKTADGIGAEARRMGYLHPGEFPIVVEGLKPPMSLPDAPLETSPPAAAQTSPLRRFWRHLSGH